MTKKNRPLILTKVFDGLGVESGSSEPGEVNLLPHTTALTDGQNDGHNRF
jgi:hypothetical protein